MLLNFFFEFFAERYKHISRESHENIIFLLYFNVKQNDLYNLIFLVESLIWFPSIKNINLLRFKIWLFISLTAQPFNITVQLFNLERKKIGNIPFSAQIIRLENSINFVLNNSLFLEKWKNDKNSIV